MSQPPPNSDVNTQNMYDNFYQLNNDPSQQIPTTATATALAASMHQNELCKIFWLLFQPLLF